MSGMLYYIGKIRLL